MTLKDAVHNMLLAPAAIARGSRPFYGWLGLYALTALAIFGGLALLVLFNQVNIKNLLFEYLFPENWHWVTEKLVHFFYQAQTKVVLASMIISASLIVTSALLFPLKEHCSITLERDIHPQQPPRALPLWLQALEESKLIVLYIAAQAVILGIGYYPYDWTKWLSSLLGMLFLFFTFGLDFIAPPLQRHGARYVAITQLLLKFTPATLLFGAVFSTPLLLLGRWLLNTGNLTLLELSCALFTANIVFMVLAIPAGTWVGLKLRPEITLQRKLSAKAQSATYIAVAAVFLLGVGFHTMVAKSLHHKSQLLKCNYDIQWGSIHGKFAGFKAVFLGKQATELQFNMRIENPTAFNVDIEKSRLVIMHNKVIINTTDIAAIVVPSRQTVMQPIDLKAQFDLKGLSVQAFMGITDGWEAHIEFELMPGIPLMLKLL